MSNPNPLSENEPIQSDASKPYEFNCFDVIFGNYTPPSDFNLDDLPHTPCAYVD